MELVEKMNRERLIGIQICIVRMIHWQSENTLFPMSVSDVANCMRISEDEVRSYVDGCSKLFDSNVIFDVTFNFCKNKNKIGYIELRDLYKVYGKTYLRLATYLQDEKLQVWIEEIKGVCIRNIFEIEEEDISLEIIKEALDYYVEYYVNVFEEMIEKGIDLEVIQEMAKNLLEVKEIKQLLLMRSRNKSLVD